MHVYVMLCLSMCTTTYFPRQYVYVAVCMFMHVYQCMKEYVLSIYLPLYFLHALVMCPPMRIGLSKCICVYKDICVHLFQRIYICTYACHYVCGCRCLYVFDNVCIYANAYIYLFVNVIGATSS